ncbi:MAG: glycosyltransferase family 2 protein [Methanobacterium sp.]
MELYKTNVSLSKKNTINDLTYSNIKISIIIPVYNVDKYLKQCLDSVINQTLKNIEIICVNDGSTDNSSQILKEYAKKDDRINVINQENAGQGAARNTGLTYAKGDYIGFVDSDDWVDITMFEKFYKNAKFHESDIVMGPILIVNESKEEFKDFSYYDLNYFNEDFNNSVFNYKKTKEFILRIAVTVYNKIYKTELINKINAKFPEGLIFEDNPFFYQTYLNAKNVSLIREYLYFHRVNRPNSIVTKANERFSDMIKIKNLNIKNFSSLTNFKDYEIDLLNNKIGGIFYRYFQVPDMHKQEFFELIKQDFKEMNLKNEDLNKLTLNSKNNFLNIINSNSYQEFELLKEKDKLLESINKLTNQNKQFSKNNNQLKSEFNQQKFHNNQLQNQLNIKTNEMAEYLTLKGYIKYKSKNIAVRIKNRIIR